MRRRGSDKRSPSLTRVSRWISIVVLVATWSSPADAASSSAQRGVTQPQPAAQVPSVPLSEQIGDSAAVKLLILDLSYNMAGIGWDDREKWGAGRTAINEALDRIARKYGYKSGPQMQLDIAAHLQQGNQEDVIDLPTPPGMSGGLTEGRVFATLRLPGERFHKIIELPKNRKIPDGTLLRLPNAAYGWGELSIDLKSMSVGFTDATRCLLNGAEYVCREGNWQRAQASAAPGSPGDSSGKGPVSQASQERTAQDCLHDYFLVVLYPGVQAPWEHPELRQMVLGVMERHRLADAHLQRTGDLQGKCALVLRSSSEGDLGWAWEFGAVPVDPLAILFDQRGDFPQISVSNGTVALKRDKSGYQVYVSNGTEATVGPTKLVYRDGTWLSKTP